MSGGISLAVLISGGISIFWVFGSLLKARRNFGNTRAELRLGRWHRRRQYLSCLALDRVYPVHSGVHLSITYLANLRIGDPDE